MVHAVLSWDSLSEVMFWWYMKYVILHSHAVEKYFLFFWPLLKVLFWSSQHCDVKFSIDCFLNSRKSKWITVSGFQNTVVMIFPTEVCELNIFFWDECLCWVYSGVPMFYLLSQLYLYIEMLYLHSHNVLGVCLCIFILISAAGVFIIHGTFDNHNLI